MGPGGTTAANARQYAAFISYSHADEADARWLHRRLEAYRVPAPLVGHIGKHGAIPKRVGKVFRDREEFAAGGELKSEIEAALDRTETLIVLCSPRSAASRYVNAEIEYFFRRGGAARIIPAIVEGEPPACFPPALLDGRERLGADFRKGKDEREGGRLKVLAGLLGVGMDEIIQRERVAQRWRLRAAAGAVLVFAGLAVAAGGFGWLAQRNAVVAADNERRALEGERLATERAEAERQARALADRNAAERDAKAQELTQELAAAYLYRAERHVERADEPAAALYFAQSNLLKPARAVRDAGLLRMQELVRPRRIIQHGGELERVDISPDGGRVLTMDDKGLVQVWSAGSGARLCTLRMGVDTYMFKRAEFTRSGKFIFTAAENARLWDARTCKPLGAEIPFEVRKVEGPGVIEGIAVEKAALDPSEQNIVLLWQDGLVQTWSARAAKPLGDMARPSDLAALASLWEEDPRPRYSPDRAISISSGDYLEPIQLLRVESGTPLGSPLRHDNHITAASFSPDSKSIVTAGGFDGTARIWDTQTGKPWGDPMAHAGNVTIAKYSPDGRFIITAAGDTATLWSSSGQLEMAMPHLAPVIAAEFSGNGRTIVTGTKTGAALLWAVEDRRLLPRSFEHKAWDGAEMLGLSADGRYVLTLWRPIRVVTGFTSDGGVVTEPGESGQAHIRLWDVQTGAPVWPEIPYIEHMRRIAFSPDGDRLVTIDEARNVQLWNAETGARVGAVLQLPSDLFGSQDVGHAPAVAAYFAPDGKRLLITNSLLVRNDAPGLTPGPGLTSQSTLHVLDGRTGRPAGAVLKVTGNLTSAVLLASGEALVVLDGKVRTWPGGTRLTNEPFLPAERVRLIAMAPDGLTLVTMDTNHDGRIWDVETRTAVGAAMKHDTSSGILDICFSPDRRLIVVTDSKIVRLWDRQTGETVGAPFRLGSGLHFGEGAPRFAGATRVRAPASRGGVREVDLSWLLRDISPEAMLEEAEILTQRRVNAAGELDILPLQEERTPVLSDLR
jgi:WD40 repeat protein